MRVAPVDASGPTGRGFWLAGAMVLAALLLAGIAVADALTVMVGQWGADEYSHSYFVPVIAALLFWQRLPRIGAGTVKPSWVGALLVALALFVCAAGELSTVYTIVQYGFLLLIAALSVAALGVRATLLTGAAFVYLLFAIPLPTFLYYNLSQTLQLISSEIGVMVIRLFDISVHLEGNVIDLGSYWLQVVDACSGLRYLFPLTSFGFLVACLFQAPLWQRALVFVAAAPVTVLMNSFRIGMIGVLVEYWGIGMADGFLHYFEGWIIFIACLGVLLLVIALLHRLTGGSGTVLSRLDLSLPAAADIRFSLPRGLAGNAPLVASLVLVLGFAAAMQTVESREETVPARDSLLQFPLLHEGWLGRESAIDQPLLDTMKLTDYLIADYSHTDYALPVNLYIAYYASRRKGASVHSPRSCMPGGGWVIEDLRQVDVDLSPRMSAGDPPLRVNRAVTSQGTDRQLVYYWFKQRDRVITNEYLVKWYLFWDSLTRNRSDGALVRLVITIPDGTPIPAAESQLHRFLVDFTGLVDRFIPE